MNEEVVFNEDDFLYALDEFELSLKPSERMRFTQIYDEFAHKDEKGKGKKLTEQKQI